MHLYNYRQVLKAKLTSGILNNSDKKVKAIDGNEYEHQGAIVNVKIDSVTASIYGEKPTIQNALFPVFGNGIDGVPTEVKPDDYDLNSHSNLTVRSVTFAKSIEWNSNQAGAIVVLVENMTDEQITVCEVGLFTSVSAASWDEASVFMWHREVFEPVTVQPGESYTFTFNFA